MRKVMTVVLIGAFTACEGGDATIASTQAATWELAGEVEPNASNTQATPLSGDVARRRANIFPSGDVDVFSFTGQAGDVVYAFTQTSSSPGDGDTVLTLRDAAGVSLEVDDDNGSLGALASSIAGAVLPATGTYYLEIIAKQATTTIRPYDLYFRKRRGIPVEEIEPNHYAARQPLPGGWSTGMFGAGDDDYYSFDATAGDTLFASLDLDKNREGSEPLPTSLALGMFGGYSVHVNDGGTNDGGGPGPDSEGVAVTVCDTGSYVANASFGNGHDYVLSVDVIPGRDTSSCTTLTDTTALTLGAVGTLTSSMVFPDDVIIGDINIAVRWHSTFNQDIDMRLVSPEGTSVSLLTDMPGFYGLSFTVDDEAAFALASTTLREGVVFQPERDYRLSWFYGQRAAGTWTLYVDDDTMNFTDGAGLDGWSLTVCPAPPEAPCPNGTSRVTRFATSFDTDDGGFSHAGTNDSWAHGVPSSANVTGCRDGSAGCWKTQLNGTYPDASNQDLVSPLIDLSGLTPPVLVTWWQKHQLEDADADHAYVDATAVGGTPSLRLFEHLDPTMFDTVGETAQPIATIAGWALRRARIDALAEREMTLTFHLDSNAEHGFEGLVIDDVAVSGCLPACEAGECDDGGPTEDEAPADEDGDDAGTSDDEETGEEPESDDVESDGVDTDVVESDTDTGDDDASDIDTSDDDASDIDTSDDDAGLGDVDAPASDVDAPRPQPAAISAGCGCSTTGSATEAVFLLFALAALRSFTRMKTA